MGENLGHKLRPWEHFPRFLESRFLKFRSRDKSAGIDRFVEKAAKQSNMNMGEQTQYSDEVVVSTLSSW